ncbi:MAG: carbamate kinase [Deltaproteobacteria bacterium]|nr:carbamate kinase [Deltaproteobacteria bacterium]
MPQRKKTLLVALGGNALIRKGQDGTIEEQFDNLKIPMSQLGKLSREYRLIITHGNGPQVGNLMLQQECCDALPRLPLEILVAQTQGQIGYMIESTLDSELTALGIDEIQPLITVITYVVVDEKDPAFKAPSKPIGPVFTERQAKAQPYPIRKTAKGYRRLVVSPNPVTIVEKREISRLISMDFIVICCGGGGIPVVREGRRFSGVDAVIDKDLASAKLAEEVGVDIFVIATDEKGVALHYGTADQTFLPTLTVSQAKDYLENGEFPPGSMGPKVHACISFIANGGEKAVITHLKDIEKAVEGNAGTHVIAG